MTSHGGGDNDFDSLECSHCGGPAITSRDGFFLDGAGERCITCGHAGHVSCDSETWPAEWVCGELATDYCAVHDCDECNERRRDLIVDSHPDAERILKVLVQRVGGSAVMTEHDRVRADSYQLRWTDNGHTLSVIAVPDT